MRPFLVVMSLVNVALAALSGYFVVRAPFVFDTSGSGPGDGAAVEAVVPFVLVVGYPVFCLIAATLPFVLHGRGHTRTAVLISLLPGMIAAAVWGITRS